MSISQGCVKGPVFTIWWHLVVNLQIATNHCKQYSFLSRCPSQYLILLFQTTIETWQLNIDGCMEENPMQI